MVVDVTEVQGDYLHHLTEAGEHHDIETIEPIYNEAGVKLVGAGTSVDRALLDKLIRHKLQKPIDCSVATKDGVTVPQLLSQARRLAEEDPPTWKLLRNLKDREAPFRAVSRVHLIPALAVKLTVTQDRSPERITHAIRVALGATALGAELRLSARDLQDLATAALFHDLGEMHVDPAVFSRHGRLTAGQRRQMEAHPLIMYLLLKRFPEYHPHISGPVLEHHERFDGSGYPKGLPGDQIGKAGRILALAELAVSVCERNLCGSVSTMLKLHMSQFDSAACRTLFELLNLKYDGPAADLNMVRETVMHRVVAVRQAMESWEALRGAQEAVGGPFPAAAQLSQRLHELRYNFSRAGIVWDSFEESLGLVADDAEAVGELELISAELERRLTDIVWETLRRLNQGPVSSDGEQAAAVVHWCQQVADTLVPGVQPHLDEADLATT